MKPKYKKTYVLAPYNHATGGVELAHQLVDYINCNNGDAYIVYVAGNDIITDSDVTKEYQGYNIKIASSVYDSPDCILVMPEIFFDWMYKFNQIQLGFWWMSVDFHYQACRWTDVKYFNTSFINQLRLIKRNHIRKSRNTINDIRKLANRATQYYQSVYAQNHLYSLGFSKVMPLRDYINMELISGEKSTDGGREDLVLYNPKKGYAFTKRIIDANPDVEFVPLEGLSRGELKVYMTKAKLYIDFGNFPGKDRLPREAVSNGTCVITGKLGASYYYEDIPIEGQYKFELKNRNIINISKMIKDILSNFESHKTNFDFWRRRIKIEKDEFFDDIRNSFFM